MNANVLHLQYEILLNIARNKPNVKWLILLQSNTTIYI